jgi:AcrR family transcriptional regulator
VTASDVRKLLSAVDDPKLRPGRQADVDVPSIHRKRLLSAALKVLADRGYAETTVAEVARTAQVSRRTFYEHFETKDECLLEAYSTVNDLFLDSISQTVAAHQSSETRLLAGLDAYLKGLATEPTIFRVFHLEIIQMGSAALELRRAGYRRWAHVLCAIVNDSRLENPDLAAISNELTVSSALAAIAGINELLLQAYEEDNWDLAALRRDVLLVFVSMLSRDAVEYVDGVLAREPLQQ